MTSGQKVAFSLLISVLAFCAFTVVAFSGLFDLLEVNFYQPVVQDIKQKKIEEIASAQNEYFKTLMKRFDSFTRNDDVKTYVDTRSSDSVAKRREILRTQLLEATSALKGIRIVAENGRNLFFSTFGSDLISGKKGISYKNYDSMDEISYSSLAADKNLKIDDPFEKKSMVFKDGEKGLLIFSLPFFNSSDEFAGSIFFYCDSAGFSQYLLNKNLIDISGFAQLVTPVRNKDSKTLENFGGFVFGLPNAGQNSLKSQLLEKWRSPENGDFWKLIPEENPDKEVVDKENSVKSGIESLFAKNDDKLLCAFSRKPEREDFGFITFIYDENELKFPPYMRLLLLATAFVTLYLAVFLILSFKHDDIVIIRDKVRRYENEFFVAYKKMGETKSPAYLSEQKKVLERRILKSLGKKGEKYAAEFKSLFDGYWNEMLLSFGEAPAQLASSASAPIINADELKEIVRSSLEDILENGKIQIKADFANLSQKVEPKKTAEAVPMAETKPADELDEVEPLDEAEPLEEAEAVEPVEPLEPEEPVDEVESLEEAEPVEPAEEVESLEEAAPADDVEEIEEVAEAEDGIEEIEEAEALEDAESVEEVEEAESAEELDEAEPLEDVEPLDETEPLEAEEPVESVDEVESLEAVEPEESVEEVESLEEAEPFEPAEEVEEAESADELDEAEPLEPVEPLDEAEPLEPVEPLDETEPLEAVESLEPEEPLDEVEPLEPVEPVEPVEEVESLEEAAPADDVEEIEEVAEAEDGAEEIEEAEALEDAESVEEVEEAELADELDEVEPLEPVEPLDETEPLEVIEPVEPAEEVESLEEAAPADDVEEIEEVAEAEEIEEAEALEDAESVEEIEEAESAEELDEVESLEPVEPLDEAEAVEPVESVEEVEEAESADELDEAEPLEAVEPVEPVEPEEPAEEVESLEEAAPADDVEEIEEVAEAEDGAEELEEAETLEDAESVEEIEEAEPADELDEAEPLEAVESLEPVEPVEEIEEAVSTEELDEVEPLEPAEPLDEVESLEAVEPEEPVEEVESLEEAAPADDVEEIEEVAEAEDGAEEIEEAEALEDAESVEEIEEAESAEEPDEVEPLEPVEPLDETEPLEAVEPVEPLEVVEPVESVDEVESLEEAEPVEPAEEVESLEEAAPADDVEKIEEVAEAEEIEEAEALEDAESVEEVEEAEPADEPDEVEPLEEAEPVESAEEVESLEPVEPAEEVESLEEAAPADDVEEIEEVTEAEELADEIEELEEVSEAEEDSAEIDFDAVNEVESLNALDDEELDLLPEVDDSEYKKIDMERTLAALPERAPRWNDMDEVELDSDGLSRKLSFSEMHDIQKLKDAAKIVEEKDAELEELEVFDPELQNAMQKVVDTDLYAPHILDSNVSPDDDIYRDEALLEKIEFGVPNPETSDEETDDSVAEKFVAVQLDFTSLDAEDSDDKMYVLQPPADATENEHYFENPELVGSEETGELEALEEPEETMPFMFTKFAASQNSELMELSSDVEDAIVQNNDGTFRVTEMPRVNANIQLDMEFKKLVDSILR